MIALVHTFPRDGAPARELIFASDHAALDDFARDLAEGPVEGRALFAPLVEIGKGLKHEVRGERPLTLRREDIRQAALFVSPGFYFPRPFRPVPWLLAGPAKERGERVTLSAADLAGFARPDGPVSDVTPSSEPARTSAPRRAPDRPAKAAQGSPAAPSLPQLSLFSEAS